MLSCFEVYTTVFVKSNYDTIINTFYFSSWDFFFYLLSLFIHLVADYSTSSSPYYSTKYCPKFAILTVTYVVA